MPGANRPAGRNDPTGGFRGGGRTGFTIVELLLVLVVGGILAGVAMSALGDSHGAVSVRSAQNNFLSLHARARAVAVEQGEVARFIVNRERNLVSVVVGQGDDEEEVRTVDFREAFGTELDGDWNELVLCMTPRGFADPGCNSFSGDAEVQIQQGGSLRTVTLRPLGQAARN